MDPISLKSHPHLPNLHLPIPKLGEEKQPANETGDLTEKVSDVAQAAIRNKPQNQSKDISGRVSLRSSEDQTWSAKILTFLKFFSRPFVAFINSILLSLSGKDQEHRKFEKYHYYSQELITGFEEIIKEPNTSDETRKLYKSLKLLDTSIKPKDDEGIAKFHLANCIKDLEKSSTASDKNTDCRAHFKSFLSNLRLAMATEIYTNQNNEAIKTIVESLCYSMYTQVNMNGYLKQLLDHVIEDENTSPTADGTTTSTVDNALTSDQKLIDQFQQSESIYQRIKAAPDSQKINPAALAGQSIRGEFPNILGFDPNMQGNPPFGKFKLQVGGISVTNLRMSSPTIGVEINPEFKGYLRALKTRKEKHLYINLQQAHGGSNAGENERSEAFRRLSLELEFKDTLTLVTLDKNTSFYGQKDTFGQEKMSFKTFKDTFISRISSSDSGFYLPETIGEITKEQVLNIFGTMLDDIHKNYFDGREKLTVEERQNMIEIAYNLMITKFIQLSGAKYYNNSCKDCIDRGGGANALMNNTVAFLKQDTKDLDLLQTMTFSDALWARKREIIYERLERSLKAMEVIVNKPESREWMLEQMGNPQIKHFKAKDNQTIRS